MPTAVLGAICLIAALLLAVVNMITVPIMEARQNEKNMEALRVVLPGASDLKETDAYDGKINEKITSVWEGTEGYVFTVTTAGKNAGMVVRIGIDPNGKITGTKCTANNETKSYADPVFEAIDGGNYYKGQAGSSFEPYLKSGATLTSKAYSDAVKMALDAYATIKGGN
jgi:Na+-translocating ferredoxin:NAD+ oxidoreductase RnfG subunit